jgi:hypothetical protein
MPGQRVALLGQFLHARRQLSSALLAQRIDPPARRCSMRASTGTSGISMIAIDRRRRLRPAASFGQSA